MADSSSAKPERFAPITTLAIVTVVFEAEYDLLELQARSFDAFLDGETVERIIVIDNSSSGMPSRRRRSLLRSYGRHAGQVDIRRNSDIALVPSTIGWKSQQVLKIRVADTVGTSAYVVLDAKNHLIRPTGRDVFVSGDRPRANFYHYDTHPLRGTLETVLDYFVLDRPSHIARFTATATPFLLLSAACTALVADLEVREGTLFADLFVERGFTEFFLYSAWLESTGSVLDRLYDDSGIPNPVVWPKGRSRDGVAATLALAEQKQAHVLSIHRTALARMDRDATTLIVDFWVRLGFFHSVGAARAFIRRYRARYVVSMGLRRLRGKSA